MDGRGADVDAQAGSRRVLRVTEYWYTRIHKLALCVTCDDRVSLHDADPFTQRLCAASVCVENGVQ